MCLFQSKSNNMRLWNADQSFRSDVEDTIGIAIRIIRRLEGKKIFKLDTIQEAGQKWR